jgi:hypothetical protein
MDTIKRTRSSPLPATPFSIEEDTPDFVLEYVLSKISCPRTLFSLRTVRRLPSAKKLTIKKP